MVKACWLVPIYIIHGTYVVIIVDRQEEHITFRECIILGIPIICLSDTNYDMDLAGISILAKDEAIVSFRLILDKLVFAIYEGCSSYM
ncbi:hypothetical protein EUGRSUZ_L01201 [Eucalyptus grandis]|uniref:Small ribosomal subunit protein uS2c n=1 Tax=Eucalyptus grandis TaxID=71139 RepID=A0A058ZUY3_EUCGR|nr:hypothetical protein EUGRSUZ_L01201 [Eucalyptus grandis]